MVDQNPPKLLTGGQLQLRLRDAKGQLLTQSEDLGSCVQLEGRKAQGGHVLLRQTLDAGSVAVDFFDPSKRPWENLGLG